MKGRIIEVFESIQGEGIYLGERQIFVRFYGCNLSCLFCDTTPDRYIEYEPEELLRELKLYTGKFHSVAFTGGEPLLQVDFLKEVLKLTRKEGYKNYLETNGTLFYELKLVIDQVDIVAMDLKLPTSSGMGSLWWMHRKFLEIASEKEVFLKAVICDSTSEEDLRFSLRLIGEVNKSLILVLQPDSRQKDGGLTEKLEHFKEICTQEHVTSIIIPQMHKVVGIK